MRGTILILAAVVASAAGCEYQKTLFTGGEDGAVDTGAADTTEEWIEVEGFSVLPEKTVPSVGADAAHPSIAWSDGLVGLVWRHDEGSGAGVMFALLDPLGGAVRGPEALDEGGVREAMPRISAAEGGGFLVGYRDDAGDSLAVLAVGADGATRGAGVSHGVPLHPPMSAPVLIGGKVYAVTQTASGMQGELAAARFSYPALELESATLTFSFDGMGVDPVLMQDLQFGDLIVNSRYWDGTYAAIKHLYVDTLQHSGALTTFGGDRYGNPLAASHASSSSATWFAYDVIRDPEASAWQLFRFDPIAGHESEEPFWYGAIREADAVGPVMDSDTSALPASAAAFAVHAEGRWQVWVQVVEGAGKGAPTGLFPVGELAAGNLDSPPYPTVAWTGEGFLVVWDEPDGTLSFSYVASA